MRLYAIKRPGCLLLTAFTYDPIDSWRRFFDAGVVHRLLLEEAIQAYEAIGYKCVALECEEVILDGC